MQGKIWWGAPPLSPVRRPVADAMAEALDISPSYLNLLEHNQRPLTVALLLKLGNNFDIDMKSFAEDDSPALMTDLAEVFADPLLSGERVSRRELPGPGDRRALGGARHAQPVSGLPKGS